MNQTITNLIKEKPEWWFINVLADEIKKIDEMGRLRNNTGKRLGWTSMTKDESDAHHLAGIRGEWAASLALNLPIKKIVSDKLSDLHGGDLDHEIEVKTSSGKHSWQWDLIEHEYRIKDQRIYVHAISCYWPEWMILTGWAWGSEFRKHGESRMGVTGKPLRVIKQGPRLKPIKSIFDCIKK